MVDVGLEVGSLKMFFGIGCHSDTKVGGTACGDGGVEIVSVVEALNVGNELVGVCESVGLGLEMALPWQGVASEGNDVVDAEEVEVEEFALDARTAGAAANDMGHNLKVGIAAHDGGYDGDGAGTACEGHAGVGAVGVGHIFHFVAVAGDVDEGGIELHERVEAVIKAADFAPLERGNEFETGKGFVTLPEYINDFHVLVVFFSEDSEVSE